MFKKKYIIGTCLNPASLDRGTVSSSAVVAVAVAAVIDDELFDFFDASAAPFDIDLTLVTSEADPDSETTFFRLHLYKNNKFDFLEIES